MEFSQFHSHDNLFGKSIFDYPNTGETISFSDEDPMRLVLTGA